MSSFAAEWLALREPYDLAARNAAVLDAVANAFLAQTSITVADLGCGTGATLRAVGPHLPPRQSWRLVVTTSALLDLVSSQWLDRFIIEAAARRLPVYAALSYDGRVGIEPVETFDAELIAGFNLHQRTDKGFGPALGPAAAARAVERFEHFGYAVVQGRSDWVLGPGDRAIQDALVAGWAEVGALTTAMSADTIGGWLARRRTHLAQGRSNLQVGHVDIFAQPIGTR